MTSTSNPPGPPALSPALKLALRIESACGAFETLRAIVAGDVMVARRDGQLGREHSTVMMALAQSFVANAARARRTLNQTTPEQIQMSEEERALILAGLAGAVSVRDVNEHGFDIAGVRSHPQMHSHEGGSLDETSLVVFGVDQILMGPLNLAELYVVADLARRLAGFASLPPQRA